VGWGGVGCGVLEVAFASEADPTLSVERDRVPRLA